MSVETYSISDLLRRRSTEKSFHVVSEDHVRIEFRNMATGERLASPPFSGNVVLTCFRGSFLVRTDGAAVPLGPMDQCVMPVDTAAEIECSEDGTIQFIWTPPFGVPRR